MLPSATNFLNPCLCDSAQPSLRGSGVACDACPVDGSHLATHKGELTARRCVVAFNTLDCEMVCARNAPEAANIRRRHFAIPRRHKFDIGGVADGSPDGLPGFRTRGRGVLRDHSPRRWRAGMNCAAREHNSPPTPPGRRSTVDAEGASDRWYLRIKLYMQATWQVVCDIPHKPSSLLKRRCSQIAEYWLWKPVCFLDELSVNYGGLVTPTSSE
jgi:hypothetical protein